MAVHPACEPEICRGSGPSRAEIRYARRVTDQVGRSVGVCLLDAHGNVVDVDAEFLALVGAEGAAVEGQPLADGLASVAECLGREVFESPATEARAVLATPDGWVRLCCRAREGSGAGPVAFTLTATATYSEDPDESGAELVERLRAAREALTSIIDSSPLAIVTVDRDKKVALWSPAATRIFGWTEDEILGQSYPIVPDDELEQFEALFEQVVLEGEGYTGVEATRRRKDGSRVEVNMHTAPLRDAEGRAIGGMALLEDLTDKRLLEARSRESQKMEAVGRLAGGIAHDFNNLLTVVLGNGELLLLDRELSEANRDRIDEIVRIGRSARELVAQLMTFSRRQVTRPEDLDVNQRLLDAGRLLGRLLGEAITLEVTTSSTPACVHIDPTQLDQVLVNLAVNARDAMPRGGTLRLCTSVVGSDPDEAVGGGRYVCLEICDDGEGIPAEVMPHIFEPFFTTKEEGGGTGLGLANVYAIVRHAGGDVLVDSEPGEGTRFRVLLPLQVGAAQRRPIASIDSVIPRGHERILLVEDNDAVRTSTAKLLGALGYAVETAIDGVDALDRWSDLEVDMVLTDLAMPRVGGAELAARLRRHDPTLPIVFMSGNLDVELLREQIEQGHARFLQKPVSLRELAQVTREVLDGRHA